MSGPMFDKTRLAVLAIIVLFLTIHLCEFGATAGDLLYKVETLPDGTTHHIFTNGHVNVDSYPVAYSFFYANPTREPERPSKPASSRTSRALAFIPQAIPASPAWSSLRMSLPSSGAIESLIDGEFEGWQGETIVKLMNGQIWQQTEYYYYYCYLFMPKVIIYRSGSGYKMKVDRIDKAVGVTQLK